MLSANEVVLRRKIKVALNHTDRTQVLRTVGILVITLAVLGSAPPSRKSQEGEVAGKEHLTDGGKSLALEALSERGSDLPRRLPNSPPMATVSAQAVYIIDSEHETILFEKNPDQRFPMASLTKIMTGLVVLENFALDEKVAVPELCTTLPPFRVGYAAGQKLTVEELLYGWKLFNG